MFGFPKGFFFVFGTKKGGPEFEFALFSAITLNMSKFFFNSSATKGIIFIQWRYLIKKSFKRLLGKPARLFKKESTSMK